MLISFDSRLVVRDKWHGIARRIKPWGNLAIDLLVGYLWTSVPNLALMKQKTLSFAGSLAIIVERNLAALPF